MKKKFLALLVLVSLLVGVVACSSGDSGKTEDATGGGTQPVSEEKIEEVTIRYIHFRSEDATVYEELNKKFEEQNPGIKVEMDVGSADQTEYYAILKTKIQGEADAVDVFAIHVGPQLQEYVNAGLVTDLTGSDAAKNYYDGFLDTAKVNDKVYGLPQAYNSYVVFYNKDIFEKYDLKAPTSWEELEAVCKTLKDNGQETIASGFGENWVFDLQIDGLLSSYYDGDPYVLQKLESGEIKWSDAGVKSAYSDLQKMAQNNFFMNGVTGTSYEASIALFTQGKAAMLNTGSWSVGGVLESNDAFRMGFFIIPNSRNQYYLIQDVGQSLAINAKSKKQEAAMKYLEFLSSPEAAKIYSDATLQTSTVKGVKAESEENNALNELVASYPAVRSASAFVNTPEFADLYLEMSARAFNGEDIDKLMEEAQSVTDDLNKK